MAQNADVSPHTDDTPLSGETVTSEDGAISEDTLIQCRYCQHFREEPWETGYCRHTHMYVLETFSCDKFLRKILEPE